MTMHGHSRRVDISTAVGGESQLLLDGVDYTGGVRSLTLEIGNGPGLPRLTLVPLILNAGVHLDPAAVLIGQTTADLLVSLGWTPPSVPEGGAQSNAESQGTQG